MLLLLNTLHANVAWNQLEDLVTTQVVTASFGFVQGWEGHKPNSRTDPALPNFNNSSLCKIKVVRFSPGIFISIIKTDLTKDERMVELILLKEHRSLLNSDAEKNAIKIQGK